VPHSIFAKFQPVSQRIVSDPARRAWRLRVDAVLFLRYSACVQSVEFDGLEAIRNLQTSLSSRLRLTGRSVGYDFIVGSTLTDTMASADRLANNKAPNSRYTQAWRLAPFLSRVQLSPPVAEEFKRNHDCCNSLCLGSGWRNSLGKTGAAFLAWAYASPMAITGSGPAPRPSVFGRALNVLTRAVQSPSILEPESAQ